MYQYHQYSPEPFSPDKANILEQTTQSIETSSLSLNVQSSFPEERTLPEDDENMDDPNNVDYHLKPAAVQTNEFDKDEGDTMYEGDPDEELKEDEGNQEDLQSEDVDYTGEDTIPNTAHAEEEEDNESLPPDGDEEEL